MEVIPIVVISTLLFSLVESLLILPVHLSDISLENTKPVTKGAQLQDRFSQAVEKFISRVYEPFLARVLRWRWSYLTVFIAIFLISLALLAGGWLRVVLFSSIEADVAVANISFAEGTHSSITESAIRKIEGAALELKHELTDKKGESPISHVFSVVGPKNKISNVDVMPQLSHLGRVSVELSSAATRDINGRDITEMWRVKVGDIRDATGLTFSADLIPPEPELNIELSGYDLNDLTAAAEQLKKQLTQYRGVYDIQDSQQQGKSQVILALKPVARDLGLTMQALGHQVHQAFHGVEVQSIQRGEDEVKVVIRYPDEESRSLWHLENMRIQLPGGSGVPLFSVADVSIGAATSSIKRYERKKVITVSAFVNRSKQSASAVMARLESSYLNTLTSTSDIKWSKSGKQKSIEAFISVLEKGYLLALLGMYLLMAVLFSSYSQPLMIMFAIPFGLIGALFGHLLLGIDITLWSLIGMVAVSGVVVNDNLVLVDYINQKRDAGCDLAESIRQAGVNRFRPVVLTSLTTFAGLTPLILETSLQAQFLIPMAVSLAFGVLFATLISLILVPATYFILDDINNLIRTMIEKTKPERKLANETIDTVEEAYNHGFNSALRSVGGQRSIDRRSNPYNDEVLASGWEAGWQDGHQ